jgi:hypothetical protein
VEPGACCRPERALRWESAGELAFELVELVLVLGARQSAPSGDGEQVHGLDGLGIDGGIASGIPRANLTGMWNQSQEPVGAVADPVAVLNETVPEDRALQVAHIDHTGPITVQKPMMVALGSNDVGQVGEVELEGRRFDGLPGPEPVRDTDLVVEP